MGRCALQAPRQFHASCVAGNTKDQVETSLRAPRRERQLPDRAEKIERQRRTAKLLAALNLTSEGRFPDYTDRLRKWLRLYGRKYRDRAWRVLCGVPRKVSYFRGAGWRHMSRRR